MIKRAFDLVISFFGIIVLAPFLIIISIWIKKDSPGPVFFIQKRVGLNGKDISVLKFRSMVIDAEKKGLKITVGKDPRITPSGFILRKYKIDELAQLFNVFIGTMSFVGPRPEVREYINEYSDEIRNKILSVKPGITDYASIEFKNENELLKNAIDPHRTYIDEIMPIKQKYYLRYVNDNNVFLDIKLILKTIVEIIK